MGRREFCQARLRLAFAGRSGLFEGSTSTYFPMAGLGKFLKQAQKAQKQMETLQLELAARELEASAGGGAVRVKINGQSEFLALTLDPEFLKEDASLVADTILEAVKQASAKAKALNTEEMNKLTSQFQMPGLM
jgi:nucleoid-associated protein EbfC